MKNTTSLLMRNVATACLACAAQAATAETITVSAAASLADAFRELATRFEVDNPGDIVQLNIGGTGALERQIDNGAPVDVFATADEITMRRTLERGHVAVSGPSVLARNTLVLIQPTAAQTILDSADALRAASVQRIAIGNPDSVPAGRYTQAALQEAGHWDAVQVKLIRTQNVRQALDYVARGEVDAGFVYGTDAALMKGKVRVGYIVPVAQPIIYSIAVLRHGEAKPAAQRFVDLALSPDGQAVLSRFGFSPAD